MTLRWFATGPIYFNRVRAFSTGDYVPDSIVTEQGLTTLGLVAQVDIPGQDPALVTRPLTTSDRDTDAEREAFVPTRLSDVSLRAALGAADPVLANFVYDGAGNLTNYTEDGIPIVLTYNADGTVSTSKRGTNATKTYSYSGSNLVGVA